MTPAEAAKLLELPADATPEQLEARFLELRRKLEDKIAKAPTPGLQAKYRESLAQITTAFETLILAADSSALPILDKQSAVSTQPSAGVPVPPRVETPHSAIHSPHAKKKSNTEFLVVTLLAVALLGAGGWFVMKTRAEKAEQARLAAVAAEEKARAEIVAKAEADRLAAQATVLRTKLAESRVEWEALESDLRDAERKATDLKSELRNARDLSPQKKAEASALAASAEIFASWLKNFLVRHPVKLARARTEELLQAREIAAATAACDEMLAALAAAPDEINRVQDYFLQGTGNIELESTPAGVRWILTDPYGNTQEGTTPALLTGLPLTHLAPSGNPSQAGDSDFVRRGEFAADHYTIRFLRTGWADVTDEVTLIRTEPRSSTATFPEGALKLESQPAGIPFTATNALGWSAAGKTPANLTGVPPGRVSVSLARPGFNDVEGSATIEADKTASLTLDQRSQAVAITVAEKKSKIFVNGKFAGYEKAELSGLPPGEHALQIEAEGYTPYRLKFTVKQEATKRSLAFSFKELAVQNITCTHCSGGGFTRHQQRCNQCNGTAWVDCPDCRNGIAGYVDGDYGGGVIGQKMVMCSSCDKKGRFRCESCTNGIYHWQNTCGPCGGDGKISKLQL